MYPKTTLNKFINKKRIETFIKVFINYIIEKLLISFTIIIKNLFNNIFLNNISAGFAVDFIPENTNKGSN